MCDKLANRRALFSSSSFSKISKSNSPPTAIVKRYDIEEAKRRAEFFYKGRRYKIMKAGGSISGYTDKGVFWSHVLEAGSVVTYECFVFCNERNWSYRSFSVIEEDSRLQGVFWPQELISIDTSFFEKLEE